MKKVILLLLLANFAKAQIVGGFMPRNSTSSFTAGAAQFTTLRASLGGTITGQATLSNTVNLIGNTRLISSATNTLTTGNTGTVAVLSDALFSITFSFPSSNPSDGATSFFGNAGYPLSSSATFNRVKLPYNCTLVGWDLNIGVFGTIGSAETNTLLIRSNNTTDYTLSTTLAYSVATGYNPYIGNVVSQSFSANDEINAKHIFNTFVTNPTNVYEGLTLWFVRRP